MRVNFSSVLLRVFWGCFEPIVQSQGESFCWAKVTPVAALNINKIIPIWVVSRLISNAHKFLECIHANWQPCYCFISIESRKSWNNETAFLHSQCQRNEKTRPRPIPSDILTSTSSNGSEDRTKIIINNDILITLEKFITGQHATEPNRTDHKWPMARLSAVYLSSTIYAVLMHSANVWGNIIEKCLKTTCLHTTFEQRERESRCVRYSRFVFGLQICRSHVRRQCHIIRFI